MLTKRPKLAKLSNLQLLGRLKNLSWLSPEQIQNLHDAMTVREARRREVIFREEGRPSSDSYILLLGSAELNHVGRHGSRTVVFVSPGLILKMPEVPEEVGHNFELVALNDCRVASLPTDTFAAVAVNGGSGTFTETIYGVDYQRLGNLLARYPSFVRLNLAQRVALTLSELVRDFGVRDARGMLLRISPTHRQLADLVGASRSKVTQAILDLERRKVIAREGRRLILDPVKARSLLTAKG